MMYERINRPAGAAITQARITAHLRLDGLGETELEEAQRYAAAATREVEDYAQVALLAQTVRVTFKEVAADTWTLLPVVPVAADGSITATVDGLEVGVELAWAQRPAVRFTEPVCGAVVEYQAGFGADAEDVPDDLAMAVADQAATLFDRRGASESKAPPLSPHAARIAARYRRVAL